MKRLQSLAVPLRLALELLMAWGGLTAAMTLVPATRPSTAEAAGPPLTTVPPDFHDAIILRDLDLPTSVRFAPDGRVFVTEKKGVIKVFADPYAVAPMLTIDLQTNVNSYWGHGLSGLAFDPQFPAVPDIYFTYTHDAPIGGTAPVWNDECADYARTGCETSGRLSRMPLTSPTTAGPEEVLIEAWCQQGVTHSIDDVAFGPDGELYVSAGEGANHFILDIGTVNTCNDPYPRGGRAAVAGYLHNGRPAWLQRDSAARRSDQSERPAGRRLRAAEPLPADLPARHEPALARRCRQRELGGIELAPGRDRRRRSRTSAGPATKGLCAKPASTRSMCRSARASIRTQAVVSPPARQRLTTPTSTIRWSHRAMAAG